jgi:hypothetical protein
VTVVKSKMVSFVFVQRSAELQVAFKGDSAARMAMNAIRLWIEARAKAGDTVMVSKCIVTDDGFRVYDPQFSTVATADGEVCQQWLIGEVFTWMLGRKEVQTALSVHAYA